MAAPLATVTRRDVRTGVEVVESTHVGHLAVVAADGTALASVGDPGTVIYVRSAAKPFQASACLELLPDHDLPHQLSAEELAVAWASHRGEPRHLAAVRALLARSGTAEETLTCPPARTEHDPCLPEARLQHNCSGKHALFALLGRHLGVSGPAVLDPDGAVQRPVLAALAEQFGGIHAVAVDGCGAPAVAAPLDGLAAAFARFAVTPGFAAVREAGFAAPGLVGGEGRLETALLAAGVVAKIGAEGVFGAGWIAADGTPVGLAVKAADGAARAATAAVVGALVAGGVIAADVWEPPPPLGGGLPQGQVRASAEARAVLGSRYGRS